MLLAADLAVTSITGTSSSYDAGQRINARVDIANQGSLLSNTGPFQLEYWLSRNGVTSRHKLIETAGVVNVLQGVPTWDVINTPGWQIPGDVPAGTYHITVYLDTGNAVAEEDETNNVGKSANFTIGKPDLVVTSVDVADEDLVFTKGQPLLAQAAILNQGTGSTLPQAVLGFNVSFSLGLVDATTDEQRTLYPLQNAVVTWLHEGQSTTDNLVTTVPLTMEPGRYQL